jgi:hypothetical protein
MQFFPICRQHGKSKILRDQRRVAEWEHGRETERRNSSTVKRHSMEAGKHLLSDQVGQLQSKLDRRLCTGTSSSAWNSRKRTLECVVTRMFKSCTNSRRRHLKKDGFESLVHTSTSGADSMESGFSGAGPSRLQLMQGFKHS